MKKIFILLISVLLLTGCIESVAVLGAGATNGKLVQSSLQTGASYGLKKTTGKTTLEHVLSHVNKNKTLEKKIISEQSDIKKKKFSDRPSKAFTSSLQSSINEKSKIKYLD
jgi:hypothetical protein